MALGPQGKVWLWAHKRNVNQNKKGSRRAVRKEEAIVPDELTLLCRSVKLIQSLVLHDEKGQHKAVHELPEGQVTTREDRETKSTCWTACC